MLIIVFAAISPFNFNSERKNNMKKNTKSTLGNNKETMTFDDFQKIITEKVQKKLDEKIEVKVIDVIKNNGVVLKGLTFQGDGKNISPTIYLEQFFESYLDGMELGDIADRIVDTFRVGTKRDVFDLQSFLDFKKASKRIVFKLINYEKNRSLLEKIPHKKFLDMAVVYYYLLSNEELENATILIYNNHLEAWKIDGEELDRIAMDNTPKLLKADLRSITDVLNEMLMQKDPAFCDIRLEEDSDVMYVLSNCSKIFGAAAILYADVLKDFSRKKGTDLYILPSSVHEVIIVPKTSEMEWEKLQEMVIEVNSTQVEEIEILSDSVYCYSRALDKVLPAWEVA